MIITTFGSWNLTRICPAEDLNFNAIMVDAGIKQEGLKVINGSRRSSSIAYRRGFIFAWVILQVLVVQSEQ
jgi:hypothetical protein